MNVHQQINWQMFKERLLQHPDLDLQFQYSEHNRVNPSYHITEIKQAPIISVDCGGAMNKWTEIIIQLWEPSQKEQERPMKVRKALSIINIVESKLPLNPDGIVKIEFGNSQFDVRQMLPACIIEDAADLLVRLVAGTVQCKAIERNQTCGKNTDAECCSKETEPEADLEKLAASECCKQGSGCC